MKEKFNCSGILYALLATAFWSANFIVARSLSDQINPISLAFYRWSTAVLGATPFALKYLIKDFRLLLKNIPYLCIVSFVGVSLFNTLIYFAGRSTSAVNMSMIAISAPVFIAIFAILFLKEKLSLSKISGMFIVFSGALLLVSQGHPGRIFSMDMVFGDFIMFLAAMIFAGYSILLRYKPAGVSLMGFQYATFILGLIFLIPFFIFDQIQAPTPFPVGNALYSIIYVGLFASIASFMLWNKAISCIGAVRAGIVYYTIPLFSALLAHAFLGEEFKSYHWLSFVLIISGILITNGIIRIERKAA